MREKKETRIKSSFHADPLLGINMFLVLLVLLVTSMFDSILVLLRLRSLI